MADRTVVLSQNGRHAVRGLSVNNPSEFSAYQDDDDDLTYVVDLSAYLDGATITVVTRVPQGVFISNSSNTTTRLTQRLRGFGYVDFKVQTSAGDVEEFRINILRRTGSKVVLGASGGGGTAVSDGDKGDIVVSGTGATWTIDPAVLTAAGRALIDDATTLAQQQTLGAFDTVAAVNAATIDSTVNHCRTAGYYANGDGGGALYKRVASGATGVGTPRITSNSGTVIWEVVPQGAVNVRALGASPSAAAADNTAAINAAMALGPAYVPPGTYNYTQVGATGVAFTLAAGYSLFSDVGKVTLVAAAGVYDTFRVVGSGTFIEGLEFDNSAKTVDASTSFHHIACGRNTIIKHYITNVRVYRDYGGARDSGSTATGKHYETYWQNVVFVGHRGPGFTYKRSFAFLLIDRKCVVDRPQTDTAANMNHAAFDYNAVEAITNPFSTTNGSATVTVSHPNHGGIVGSTMCYARSAAVGGIVADTLNRPAGFTIVTVIDANSYTITSPTAATSTVTNGGGSVVATLGGDAGGMTIGLEVLGTSGVAGVTTAQKGFVIRNTAAVFLLNCRVDAVEGEGIRFENVTNVYLQDVTVPICDNHGIVFKDTSYVYGNVNITGRRVAGGSSGWDGIRYEGGCQYHNIKPWIVDIKGNGINCTTTTDTSLHFHDLHIITCEGTGILTSTGGFLNFSDGIINMPGATADYNLGSTNHKIWNVVQTSGSPASINTPIVYNARNTEAVRISSAGDVAVGSNNPVGARFQVSAAGNFNAPVLGSIGTAPNRAPFFLSNPDQSYGLVIGNSAADGRVWMQAQRTDTTTTTYNITLNEAGGNVGIGMASPAHRLDVTGSARFNGNLGFYNATPVAQPASANQAAITNSTGGTRDGVLADVGATYNQATLNNNFTDLHVLVNEIRTALVNLGLMKGSA